MSLRARSERRKVSARAPRTQWRVAAQKPQVFGARASPLAWNNRAPRRVSRRRRHVGCLGESVGALCVMWLMCGHTMQRAAAVRCRARIAPASGLANLRSYPEPTDLRCGSGPTAAGNSRGAGQRRIHDDSVRHARPPIMVVTTSLIPCSRRIGNAPSVSASRRARDAGRRSNHGDEWQENATSVPHVVAAGQNP